ncbi:FAD-dependent oxidoreductase [Brunnivagina elsteri]|uniref:FAD-binding domain-containing protein n=1 Tax=Brunnivagina elsteri CCALA 953 TaxID=987040 RepID=A0A2A2TMS2_9CYAN|nr:NAD(P)/FAD-dependent oxidoreductase [Calothrix elsteri]PAX59753.1 hypothetical protein CK510_05625 [Calothrix elsteri CCALA 953]
MLNQSDRAGDNVLIVGGGPAGLATALVLAKRGWTNITVLEQCIASDYYEQDKSFNYLIDGRGQDLTDLLGLTEELSQISVPSTEFHLTLVKADGSSKTSKVPVVDPNRKAAYWIPRRAFVSLLDNEVQRNWQGKITVLFNAKCIEIRQIVNTSDEVENLEVITQINGKEIIKFSPQFLLGCDGIGSIVRSTLNKCDASNSDQFTMKLFPSPSTGFTFLWSINFFIRLGLSRVLPFIYSPPSFFLLQNHQLSYRQIWQKAQNTTRNLYLLLLLLLIYLLSYLVNRQ